MSPAVALFLTSLFIAYLFARDYKQEPNISSAVWIPTMYLLLMGSRSVSSWLGLTNGNRSAEESLMEGSIEGSPVDALVIAALMFAAFVVLWKRRLPWGSMIRSNAWLFLFFLFGAVSIVWSDFPLITFKRWIKGLGDPMMALILVSDPSPGKAVEKVIKRCAYVLIPLSIIFIKYYPGYGRAYSDWTGEQYFTGVTTNKNQLGYVLFVCGLYFVSTLLGRAAGERYVGKQVDLIIAILFLCMIAWLFRLADSMTALLTLIIASIVVVGSRYKFVRAHLLAIILVCVIFVVPLTVSIILSTGRDLTLTGRTDLWPSVLRLRVNDWVGAGYETFWLGERLRVLWDEWDFRPTQAHNGYLEIFLNLGGIGLCLFVCALCSSFRRIRRKLTSSEGKSDTAADTNHLIFATFGTGFFIAYALYNVTEATFKALTVLYMVFLFLSIEFPRSDAKSLRRLAKGNRDVTALNQRRWPDFDNGRERLHWRPGRQRAS